MNIVIVGHVDHGKSTLLGRMLVDTNSLPKGKLEQVEQQCKRNSKPFEYAFLIDALKDERAQGITIDTARCFFKTNKRNYIILDAPGHIEFLKNMITGAARAEAALLVIDAKEGVKENSKRHGYMLSMLGIKQVAIVINKMDLVGYNEKIFQDVMNNYIEFLEKIGIKPLSIIPVSAFQGDNIVTKSSNMQWYNGRTILETLDNFICEQENSNNIFRMPVQDVYKFTKNNDDRRIVAGTITSGIIHKGDKVVFYPSGKKSTIKNIETFPDSKLTCAKAGRAAGVTLEEQIYIKRGEIMTVDGQEDIFVATKIKANLFWLGKENMTLNKRYYLKIGQDKVGVVLEKIINVLNSSSLNIEQKEFVEGNEVAECILRADRPIAFDIKESLEQTSRFVIVDNYEISGGGIILNSIDDEQTNIRHEVLIRNYKWERSEISSEKRAEIYCQKSILFILTGEQNVGKKELAKAFEKNLVQNGRIAYYLGIGTFLYGVDSDIKNRENENHEKHIKKFAEVANVILDAGLILIITARSLTKNDIDIIKTVINGDIEIVWIGEKFNQNVDADIYIKNVSLEQDVLKLKQKLIERGCIFKI